MSDRNGPVILVDGSSFLFRAFHALPPLNAPDGTPTGAIHGVVNMLLKMRREAAPSHMAVVFDAPGKTFRDDIYPDYKAHRPPLPDDLRVQIEPVHALVRALGFPLLCVEGVEADDVIGTLMHEARENGEEVIVATADKDFAQLVAPGVTLVNTMSNKTTDVAAVEEKYGIHPGQFIDFLALVGDKVDNIPGVPGCGPKTATKWINQYGSLDGIIRHAEEIKGKVGQSLRDSLEFLPISRELVTIRTDCDLPVRLNELVIEPADVQTGLALADRYGLNSLRRWFGEQGLVEGEGVTETVERPEADYRTITDVAALDQWIERIEAAPRVAFDTETDSLEPMQNRVVGLSFAIDPHEAIYVPLAHVDAHGERVEPQLDRDQVLARLKPWLEDECPTKILQNAKFDMHALANHGITLAGLVDDSMLESYVLDPTASRHDMDTLASRELSHQTTTFEEIAGKGAKQLTFDQIEIDVATPYAAEDADITLQLADRLRARLAETPSLMAVYEEIERPLVPVLFTMERAGVAIDSEQLARQGEAIAERIAAIESQAHEIAGEAFNLGSTKQLKSILFERMGLPVKVKTPKGEPSTNEEALSALVDEHPLAQLILDYRGLTKLKTTYIDRLPERIDPDTGRVHSMFHQAVTATGRLSSSNPNLQNIPVRTEEGRRIRKAFVASPGHKLVSADYSQIELRIMAHLSGDEGLLKAFEQGEDIHRATAREVFADGGEVSDEQRRAAKAINFGLIYGMSAFGLARQIGVGRTEAQDYIDRYFARYPGVARYMDETRARAHERGFVETVFGRRLYLPELKSRNGQRRQYAERTAINAPMQGTAADIIKRAMLALHANVVTTGRARMIIQVHDELIFEVPADEATSLADEIERTMIRAADLRVPLEVGIGIGESWDEAH
ncbi:DNA polymerase I [Guyparkeria hydrothermalis]|uniref:DNA polymerase I n=1 Tax=Guyparkeria TaxID=2035712 RepID=UPI0010AC8705|nr:MULTISPECIES: DNA polymerase I [Guyparkeria]MCL7751268.1 DNA polymerase I [Guyparkeria hydrothermalis]TKA89622.1 DNA polymerase I [Guyparkeria sp. SB14A]